MKKILLLAAMALMFTTPALAGFEGPSGKADVTSTDQLRQAHHDDRVELVGYIVERLGGSSDKYMFKDDAGTILVEIDDKVFRGQKVTPETKVRIFGEVDGHHHKDKGMYVDVERLTLE